MNKKLNKLISYTFLTTVCLLALSFFRVSSYAAEPIPGEPKLTSIYSTYQNSITIEWEPMKDVEGYYIYRQSDYAGTPQPDGSYKAKNGLVGYSLVGTVYGAENTKFIDYRANNGRVYEYTVQAFPGFSKSAYDEVGLYGYTNYHTPYVYEVKYSDITDSGFRITGKVVSSGGISQVMCGVWTNNNGQDDLQWHRASYSNGYFSVYIPRSSHKNEFGEYNIHIYAYDRLNKAVNVNVYAAGLNYKPKSEQTHVRFLPTDADCEITFIAVSHGDSILVESKGEYLLIDAGRSEHVDEIVRVLHEKGVKNLSVLISHVHYDHLGGLRTIADEFKIDRVYIDKNTMSEVYIDQVIWDHTKDFLMEKAIPIFNIPKVGTIMNVGNAELEILGPLKHYTFETNGSTNMNSAWIKMTCNNMSTLFVGDAEALVEEEMSDFYGDYLHADVLKVPHHGHETSSSFCFIDTVKPKYAITSFGFDGGFETERIQTRYKAYDVETFQTDENGNIVFKIYEDHYEIGRHGSVLKSVPISEESE